MLFYETAEAQSENTYFPSERLFRPDEMLHLHLPDENFSRPEKKSICFILGPLCFRKIFGAWQNKTSPELTIQNQMFIVNIDIKLKHIICESGN